MCRIESIGAEDSKWEAIALGIISTMLLVHTIVVVVIIVAFSSLDTVGPKHTKYTLIHNVHRACRVRCHIMCQAGGLLYLPPC